MNEAGSRTLGEVLYDIRTNKLKLSLRKASDLVGISHNYLNLLEKGIDPRNQRPIQATPEILKRLSEGYDYPYSELLSLGGFMIEHEETSNKVNLKEILQGSKQVTFEDKELNSKEKRKIIDIIKVLLS
ncbi:helix-turn-helix domain-containing protein [Mesobacillus selenatarsenatis]|uniref:HTH cro/C1-type domain-containing protein n=1 Tax=Mesobacillus selenatarsenatis (strain DSM 18680 / JCM 14380 / FERM P-15431 / SF-1) TaxID=1321606 RepID=A0A0A8X8J9_MESS1|nr:helix-turn-helix transcriptional regulator [Mesobacillus selenatarsenatis]GAM16248.1 hypothetical protein SAMD00020551_4436 [Mesobacillus selenatarsenatis SF-1]